MKFMKMVSSTFLASSWDIVRLIKRGCPPLLFELLKYLCIKTKPEEAFFFVKKKPFLWIILFFFYHGTFLLHFFLAWTRLFLSGALSWDMISWNLSTAFFIWSVIGSDWWIMAASPPHPSLNRTSFRASLSGRESFPHSFSLVNVSFLFYLMKKKGSFSF